MRFFLFFSLSFLLISVTADAQRRSELGGVPAMQSVMLRGRVVDGGGNPIEGATVTVSGGTRPVHLYTAMDGSFAIALPAGEYDVTVSDDTSIVTKPVQVLNGLETLTLTMPQRQVQSPGDTGSVSVATLKLPKKAREAVDKAEAALAKGKAAAALAQANRALSIAPRCAQALTMRAIAYLSGNQRALAEADLNAAIQADSSYVLPYVVLAANDNDSAQFDAALRLLSTAERLDGSRWQVHFEMARALAGKGQFLPALREIESGERLQHPLFAPLLLLKGELARRLNRGGEALQAFREFLKINPHDREAPQVRALVAQLAGAAR